MRVREFTNAERDAWRQKGLDKAGQLILGLKEKDLDEESYFHALDTMLASADYSIVHCREIFNELGIYAPRDGLHKSDLCQKDIDDLAGTAIKAQAVGECLAREMGKTHLSRVNGTSLIFNKWAERFGLCVEAGVEFSSQSGIVIPRELAYK